MTEHEKAIKRLEDATVHEVYGRYQEALDLLSKPYRGCLLYTSPSPRD